MGLYVPQAALEEARRGAAAATSSPAATPAGTNRTHAADSPGQSPQPATPSEGQNNCAGQLQGMSPPLKQLHVQVHDWTL